MGMEEDDHIIVDSHHAHPVGHVHPEKSKREYQKFGLVIAGITITSILLTLIRGWEFKLLLNDFMAIFFVVFASFKFINLELFAQTYRTYDIVTQKIPAWGYVFPFVEIFLGFSYLLTEAPPLLNIATMIITGVASIGVWKETRRKSDFVCACLGTVIRLPLSTVSLVEDVLMFVMAATMLLI